MKRPYLLKIFLICFSFGFIACSSDDDSNSVSSISLIANKIMVNVGGNVDFTVTANNGNDVTESSTIYVDNAEIDGTQYQATTEGTFEAYAVYKDLTSEYITITVDNNLSFFTKRVLVEDYTSIWCGNCPRVSHAIEMLQNETDKVVAVGIHGPFSGKDDPFNFDFSVLKSEFDINGLPAAQLNRTTSWIYPEVDNLSQAVALTGEKASIGLAINPTLTTGNIAIDLNVKFGADYSSQNLKLVVYILESGLTADQVNYTDYYNGEHTVIDFEYDHVLRAALTDLLGDAIPPAKTSLGTEYTKNLSISVADSNVTEPANASVVAFVIDADGNVLNVRKAKVGATQTFEAH